MDNSKLDMQLSMFSKRPVARLKDGTVLEQPRSIADLVELIQLRNPECTCSEHRMLTNDVCITPHFTATMPGFPEVGGKSTSSLGNLRTQQIPRPDQYEMWEALHLAEAAAHYICRHTAKMDEKQTQALVKLRDPRLADLGALDVRHVEPDYVMHILEIINDLFFFGACVFKGFAWNIMPGIRASCTTDAQGSHIQFHPFSHSRGCEADSATATETRMHLQLATLIHEATHAFLDYYGCSSCPTYHENSRQAGGHARAFWVITTAIGNFIAQHMQGFPQIVAPDTWLFYWHEVSALPSIHDAVLCGWAPAEALCLTSDSTSPPK